MRSQPLIANAEASADAIARSFVGEPVRAITSALLSGVLAALIYAARYPDGVEPLLAELDGILEASADLSHLVDLADAIEAAADDTPGRLN